MMRSFSRFHLRPDFVRARRPHVQSHALRRTLLLVIGFVLLAWPERGHAFSDPDQFAGAPLQGGGGGRYFTASFADGYGCNVCHRGGIEPKVQVSGLPVNGYQPGFTYDIEVTWQPVANHPHALQLELLGRDGRVPGQVTLLDQAAVDARGRCGGLATGKVAAYERVVGTRKVLGVEACEAQSLRFRFTPTNVPDLGFSASIITSDKTASVEGDGVTTLRRVLRRVGEPAKSGDCTLVPGALGTAWPFIALVVLGLGLVLRVQRRRPRTRD
jgi:hypothetical protein